MQGYMRDLHVPVYEQWMYVRQRQAGDELAVRQF